MIISLLTKQDLSLLNKRSLKYKLADAEKDYMLAIVSKIIYDSVLRDKLVFKGGTAIHHCYTPQLRFSEDLDFTSLDKSIGIEEVKMVLESHLSAIEFYTRRFMMFEQIAIIGEPTVGSEGYLVDFVASQKISEADSEQAHSAKTPSGKSDAYLNKSSRVSL